MSRFADLFVALCIVAVSASIGIILYYQMNLTPMTTVAVMIVLAAMLLFVNLRSLRMHDRVALNESIETMTRRINQVAGEFDSIERRLSALETNGPRRVRQEMEPIVAEVEVIGALIRQVVETVADLEQQIGPQTRARPPVPATSEILDVVHASAHGHDPAEAVTSGPLLPKRFAALGEAGFLNLVRGAIENSRVDVHLQPVVTLPQRKIRFYETLTRLRTEDGETIYPLDYIPIAEKSGLMAALDNQILLHTMQILRRLTQRTKDVGIFCNISAVSLGDGRFFSDFLNFLESNKEVANDLVFEFSQASLKTLGPMEFEGLRAIQGLGFKFSIDRIQDMRSSFQFLAERGFRYAKISVERLLNGGEALSTDIHAADLSSYFARFGIELIADHIETETQVVDVLDFAVKYGQGFLFSPPRPVKSEIIAANSDAAAGNTSVKSSPSNEVKEAMAKLGLGPSTKPTQAPASRVALSGIAVQSSQPRRGVAPPPPTPQQVAGTTAADTTGRSQKARQIGPAQTR